MPFAYLTIIRPLNCVMASFAVYVGSLIAGLPIYPSAPVIYALIAAFLVCAAGMVMNDYFDVEIDRVNKPKRPIPAGKISKNTALAFSIILFAAGISVSYFIGVPAFAVAVLTSALLILYAWKMKKMILVGNLAISLLVALTFIFGGLVNLNVLPVLSLALLAFLANTGREIYKSIDDMMGDRTASVNSLPIKYGVLRARMIASTFILFAVILSFVPYLLNIFRMGEVYLFFIGIADIVFLASIVYAKRSAKISKIAMLIAQITFLVAALA
ncbi:MAG: UbiA family prenyltransferase [Candidatus Aenigmarchaeota archaeon]|nr:UbiA family prenyltransferase [Candidatus Aenigmarchaeota archaeon]